MKPKKNPKPFVVYMWTIYDKEARGTFYGDSTTLRKATAYRTDDIQRGNRVGPLTRVELPRPVKAEKP